MARYVFITGGVVSSLGKGLASASLGALLQAPVALPHLPTDQSFGPLAPNHPQLDEADCWTLVQ